MSKGIGLMDNWPIHGSQDGSLSISMVSARALQPGNLLAGVAPAAATSAGVFYIRRDDLGSCSEAPTCLATHLPAAPRLNGEVHGTLILTSAFR